MAIIYSYPLNDNIKPLDELVGTTEKNINGQLKTVTRNFLLQDLAEFFIVDGGLQKTITLTTNNVSGVATLNQTTGILNIPDYSEGIVDSPITIVNGNSLFSTGLTGTGTGATNANYSIFLGNFAGVGAVNASASTFFGQYAGAQAINALNSNFFGDEAGFNAIHAEKSNFFGLQAGYGATGVEDEEFSSNFLGYQTGYLATDARYSNFIGHQAGYQATNANQSNFIGQFAGSEATNAQRSNFLGEDVGYQATNASFSNFLGSSAGNQATDANHSNFFGNSAGYQATDANNSNFFGQNAGYEATDADYSNFIGFQAGYQVTGVEGEEFRSNFIGYEAGRDATNAADSNFFGFKAGQLAINANNSNFIGRYAGSGATSANYSNFIGVAAGEGATDANHSNLLGLNAGSSFADNNIGSNNIIIGTNISLPDATANSLNIGGILFGTGTYSDIVSDTPSITPTSEGKIGIGVVEPTNTLHIYSETEDTSGLRLERLTSSSPTAAGQAIGVDASGNVVTVEGGGGGSQNLQQVTDIGATTTNGIYSTVNVADEGALNGFNTNDEGTGVFGDVSGLFGAGGVFQADSGTGMLAYSVSGKSIVTFGNGTVAIESNLGSSGNGLVINSGASSTGNPIVINKNGVDKLVVNQQGELTATKLIKEGGTGLNALLDNGNTIALSGTNTGDQDLQSVTDNGANTTNTISVNVTGVGTGVYGFSPNGVGVNGYSQNFIGVQGYSETGIGVQGYSETGIGGSFETDSVSANIANFKQSGSILAFFNNNGELTAQKLIKSGGTSSQILAADGEVITAGTNITITGGQISSVGGSGGGGSSVNYYLNGGTSQGTFGGTTYYEFSKTAVIGTGVDFSRGTNGYIASFITDVADPSLLLIPAGNWNLEFFFSASSNGGTPSFYVELYKYDGTTFTLITSNSATPEGITNGTAIDAYFTPLAVPETILTVNDRLAIRVFVNASSKTITLHTQNGHLCEVITTFTAGLTALNGLQAQVQNFATGTTGTDFDIVSSGSTHTFNLPSASATARGVVTTASQTFAGDKTFTGAISASNLSGTNTGDETITTIKTKLGITTLSGSNTGDQDLSSYALLASPTFTGTVVLPSTTSIGTVSSTEIGYLDNVTSSIQTQLDNKIAKNVATTYTTNTITTVTAAEYAAIVTKDANTLYFIV